MITPNSDTPYSFAFVDGDRLLVGSRASHSFISVGISDGAVASTPFISALPDEPEFLLNVKGPGSAETLSQVSDSPINHPTL